MIENNNIEFKRELSNSFEKEVVAFLNSNGGHIYVGVNDDGSTYGVSNIDEIQLKIKDIIKDKVSPSPVGYYEIITEIKDNKNIIHIIIASGNEKPYYIRKYGMCPQGSYTRIGSSCVQLTEKQIFEMYSKRTRTSLVNIISPIQDLTFKELKIYYDEIGYSFTSNTFKQLNLVLDNGKYNFLAYLLSDQNSLVINVGEFKGKNVIDLIELKSYSNQSLIKTAYEIVEYIENKNKTFVKIASPKRIEKKLFDSVAAREAIINAIVHNDYSYENSPTFRLFDDHMEIISVGGLPDGLETEEFLGGYMSPKNPQLMKVFRDLGLVEHMGTGIIRILNKYDKSIFNFTHNFIKVSIPYSLENENNNDEIKNISKRQKEIIKLIKEKGSLTQEEIASKLDISRYTVIRDIKVLEEKKLIIRKGSNKTGTWEIEF